MTTASGADEAAYWNNAGGLRWSGRSAVTERVFAPLTAALFARARPRPGERVLDVGCGCGLTSTMLAEAVGREGRVVGVDISQPMLEVARARDESQRATNLSFVEADAAQHAFEPGSFDLAFSQFGVMFFADPRLAFANIRRAVAGGRLSFMCWREPAANPWQTVPARAAEPLLPPGPPRRGLHSFADPAHVRALLREAGFDEIAIDAYDADLPLGATAGEAAAVVAGFGALGPRLDGLESGLRERVIAAVTDALGERIGPTGVTLAAGTWIVTARAV